jgi:hypothetical protein
MVSLAYLLAALLGLIIVLDNMGKHALGVWMPLAVAFEQVAQLLP